MKAARLKKFFLASPVLVLTAAAMILDLTVCIVGLMTDHTIITGMPAWVKPTKFAISTGIYALSLVFIIGYTPVWKHTLRVVEVLTGLALTLEIVLIDLQAARHTTSHFNVATPFDRHVFEAMGTGIGVLWLSAIVLAVATFRTRYKTPTWTVAVRYGMLLAVLGAGSGGFMAAPSHTQLEQAKVTHHMTISGSHTIGGPDGGEGLPIVGWSTRHGDVRVAHFAGLHGLQVLVLLAFLLERSGIAARRSVRIMGTAVAIYGSFFLITLAEALLKEPITNHGVVFNTVWLTWAGVSVLGLSFFTRDRSTVAVSTSASPMEIAA